LLLLMARHWLVMLTLHMMLHPLLCIRRLLLERCLLLLASC
jgi:hypothetical protein